MKNRLTFLALFGVLTLTGCPGPVAPICGAGLVCLPDTGVPMVDTGVPPTDTNPSDARGDTNRMMPDMGPVVCNASGRPGSQCRDGACSSMAMCLMIMPTLTLPTQLMAPQGDDTDPMHMGYQSIQDPIVASENVPFNGLRGTYCAQQCDTRAMADGCGACATCSTQLTQAPLVAQFGGTLFVTGRTMPNAAYGANTGLCMLSCDYSPTTRGDACAMGQTCYAFTEVCVDECTSDEECSIQYGATYDGELVTFVPDDSMTTCNRTTGRCETPTTATATVGSACPNGSRDCAPGSVCLNGGMCSSFGCSPAGTAASTCAGGVGICLNVNENQTLCLPGCNTAMDCAPGNVCNPIMGMIGTFMGYCIGACGDDSECRSTETCTNGFDAMGVATNGRCVPRCANSATVTQVGMRGAAGGCMDNEYCRRDADSAPTGSGAYGNCRVLGAFCGTANTDALPARDTDPTMEDCAPDEVCDETLAGPARFGRGREVFADGHCVNPCAATADCSASPGTVCVTATTSPLHGLCRVACAAAGDTCPTDQVCNPTLGFCVETAPLPAPP